MSAPKTPNGVRLPYAPRDRAATIADRLGRIERHGIRVYDAATARMYVPAAYSATPVVLGDYALPMPDTAPDLDGVAVFDFYAEHPEYTPAAVTLPASSRAEPVDAAAAERAERMAYRARRRHREAEATVCTSKRPRSAGAAHKRRPRRRVMVPAH